MCVGGAHMRRKITDQLIKWKENPNRKPLIIEGARQVGKTYITIQFGKDNYKNIVYLNFDGAENLKRIFTEDLNPERIVKEISALKAESILPHETLIIFDEIQACDKALASLKYFCEVTPQYHVIASGSLLGVAVNREEYTYPVGKVNVMTMYPMDFEEFLIALGREQIADGIREAVRKRKPYVLHEEALQLYRQYSVVGGMPESVKAFRDDDGYDIVMSIQKNILNAYIADMAKYAQPGETMRIMATYNSIPVQLAKENRKFIYKFIKSGARAREYEIPVYWLKQAGIIIKVDKVSEGYLPLGTSSDPSYFKVYPHDIGLLNAMNQIPAKLIISNESPLIRYRGPAAESHVAAALLSQNYIPYYWAKDHSNELDFVVQGHSGNIIPIEVKASTNVKSKSLERFRKMYNTAFAVRISTKNIGFENGIFSLPHYGVFCLRDIDERIQFDEL